MTAVDEIGGEETDRESVEGAGPASGPARPGRSRVVLFSSFAVAAVLAVLLAVLALSKPVSQSATSSPLLGKPAPPVDGPALSGDGHFSLRQFSGEWVLVNFAASWCVPCRQETPQLARFQAEHGSAGKATVLGVSFDPTDRANLARYLQQNGATWPAVDDPSAEVAYGVSGIPESYLVSPGGVVAAKFVGGVTAAQVDAVIGKAASPAGR